MKKIELFNLYVGDSVIPSGQIGPFQVDLLSNYNELAKDIHRPETLVIDGVEKKQLLEERRGKWVHTANAWTEKEDEKSVIRDEVISDNGVWDLCQVLTFVTGRCVCTSDLTENSNYNQTIGEMVCHPREVFLTSNLAWKNREEIVKIKLEYAYLLYNESLKYYSAQAAGLLYNCIFNILCDRLGVVEDKIDKKVIESIRSSISTVLNGDCALLPHHKERIENLLYPTLNSGFVSFLEKQVSLLITYKVIQKNYSADTKKRIKFINTARNRLVHTGRFPDLNGIDREHSVYYGIALTIGVIGDIARLIMGNILGFSITGLGSKSQITDGLTDFFEKGIWRGSNIEEETFEEWLNRELNTNFQEN